MSTFHINPNNGNPGKCSAKKGNCPFGENAPHFSTAEDARQAFEMTQGASFGIEAPLLTASKTVVKDLIYFLQGDRWREIRIPDPHDIIRDSISKLHTVVEIGFSTKAAREESSKQIKQLAQDLFANRTSPDFHTALSSRLAYDTMVNKLDEHKLEDLRDEDGQITDRLVHRYSVIEAHEGYGDYTDAELGEIERIASEVEIQDLTDEEIAIVYKASYSKGAFYGTAFSSYDVEGAKKAAAIRKVATDYEILPEHVQAVLGSKEVLLATADKLDKEAEHSVGRKEQMASFVQDERRRRSTNAEVERMLAEEAR